MRADATSRLGTDLKFSARNWALICKVAKLGGEWLSQSTDAPTRYAYHMDAVIDAARAEGSDLVLKVMSGPRAGEVWLVGSGMLNEIEHCGEKIS